MTLTILVAFVALCLFVYGLYQFWLDLSDQAVLSRAINPALGAERDRVRRSRADRLVLRSRLGPWIADALSLLGWSMRPAVLLGVVVTFCLVLAVVLGQLLSWYLAPFGIVAGVLLARARVRTLRDRHTEEFIAQMPELARTLSNATSAGLSIRTAVALAADELAEPAASELRLVADEINLGVALETAMVNLQERLPSRELGILVSSLVVGSRSGGGLVTALRDIAETLDTRKEVRREIRTLYTQTVATAYAVLGVGALSIVLLEGINPGTVDTMATNPLGQGAIVFAVVVYSGCIWAVRRMTQVNF